MFLRVVTALLVFLCAGCSTTSSETASPSYEDLVSQACSEVQQGQSKVGPDFTERDFHWRKAATQFRNLSNQNQAFTDYAEGLNAWTSGSGSGKIYEIFDFCGLPN